MKDTLLTESSLNEQRTVEILFPLVPEQNAERLTAKEIAHYENNREHRCG
jgi:hypothetical protein